MPGGRGPDGKQAYRATFTVRRLADELGLLLVLIGGVLVAWISAPLGPLPIPEPWRTVLLIAGCAVVLLIAQLLLPRLLIMTMPPELRQALPPEPAAGPAPAGAPRTYVELLRAWRGAGARDSIGAGGPGHP